MFNAAFSSAVLLLSTVPQDVQLPSVRSGPSAQGIVVTQRIESDGQKGGPVLMKVKAADGRVRVDLDGGELGKAFVLLGELGNIALVVPEEGVAMQMPAALLAALQRGGSPMEAVPLPSGFSSSIRELGVRDRVLGFDVKSYEMLLSFDIAEPKGTKHYDITIGLHIATDFPGHKTGLNVYLRSVANALYALPGAGTAALEAAVAASMPEGYPVRTHFRVTEASATGGSRTSTTTVEVLSVATSAIPDAEFGIPANVQRIDLTKRQEWPGAP